MAINRRAVTKWDPPVVAAGMFRDRQVQTLTLWQQPLFHFNYAPPGTDLAARGAAMAKALTTTLAAGAESFDFSISTERGLAYIHTYDGVILTIYPEDGALYDLTPPRGGR